MLESLPPLPQTPTSQRKIKRHSRTQVHHAVPVAHCQGKIPLFDAVGRADAIFDEAVVGAVVLSPSRYCEAFDCADESSKHNMQVITA